jgi:hypothetical protein
MYVKVENNMAKEIKNRPNWIDASTGEPVTDVFLIENESIYPVVDNPPNYNRKTQKLVADDMSAWSVHEGYVEKVYQVFDLTEEEFNQRQLSEDRVDQIAIKKLLQKQLEQLVIPDEEIDDYASLFPTFKVGEAVVAGDRRQYEGEVWQVIQPHTTQLDWLPPDVPALWGRVHSPEVIPLWVQPYGAGDPNLKQTGDKVQWPEGTIWVSTIDNNTYEPGVYGWIQE